MVFVMDEETGIKPELPASKTPVSLQNMVPLPKSRGGWEVFSRNLDLHEVFSETVSSKIPGRG